MTLKIKAFCGLSVQNKQYQIIKVIIDIYAHWPQWLLLSLLVISEELSC